MNIKEQLKADIARNSVANEVEKLKCVLNNYMTAIDCCLFEMGKLRFDYCGGIVSSREYFNFSKDFLIQPFPCAELSYLLIKSKWINIEFKFHPKSGTITAWNYTVKSPEAKDKINILIKSIEDKTNEVS